MSTSTRKTRQTKTAGAVEPAGSAVTRDTLSDDALTTGDKDTTSQKVKSAGGLTVFTARHEGHDGRATSTVAAPDEATARELIREKLVANDLGHPQTPIILQKRDESDVKVSKAGVIAFDNGRRS